MIEFMFRALCGIPVVLVILGIAVGGMDRAFPFVVISIICTAGVALVVWLPLFWLAGSILLTIVKWFRKKPEEKPVSRRPFLTRNTEIATARYIKQAQAEGVGRDEITRRLRQKGWSDATIQNAFQMVSS